jgi:hypothetical protein
VNIFFRSIESDPIEIAGTLRYPQDSRILVKSVSVLQLQDGATTLFKVMVPDQVTAP